MLQSLFVVLLVGGVAVDLRFVILVTSFVWLLMILRSRVLRVMVKRNYYLLCF